MGIVKECEICGEALPNARSNQRYCPKCGKHPERALIYLEKNIIMNKAHAGELDPVFREKQCLQCGTTFATSKGRNYCSTLCERKYIVENSKCIRCGKPMTDSGKMTWRGYCSDECKGLARIDKAKKDGCFIPCKMCGKEFVSTNPRNVCCSFPCSVAFRNKNKSEQPPQIITPLVRPDRKCPQCGTVFAVTVKNTLQKFCTTDCQKQALKEKKTQRNKEMQAGKTTHLCITCKTPYVDCEWMQSKFRYLPKGAKMLLVGKEKYIVWKCPKHKA